MVSLFLVFLTALGALPMNVFASDGNGAIVPISEIYLSNADYVPSESFMARVMDDIVEVPADGMVTVEVDGHYIEMEVPRYFYNEGRRVYADDESIITFMPIIIDSSGIAPFAIGRDNVTVHPSPPSSGQIGLFNDVGGYTPTATVRMQRVSDNRQDTISPLRYVVVLNGMYYEAFCVDPNLPGPESNNAYRLYGYLTGSLENRFRPILRYGFPVNPQLTAYGTVQERAFHLYSTRVAVAYESRRSQSNFHYLQGASGLGAIINISAGSPSNIGSGIHARWNPSSASYASAFQQRPALSINGGVANAQRSGNWVHEYVAPIGGQALSPAFNVTHNRRSFEEINRFRFEWGSVPAGGASLVFNGNTYIAPAVPNTVVDSNASFQLQVNNPNESATINLVGINNAFANRVWLMEHNSNPNGFQDMVFYIAYIFASVTYEWDGEELPETAGLRIIKRSATTNQGLAGAVFQITGPDGFSKTRTTPANGVILLDNLDPGEYTVTEITPPAGYILSSPTFQAVTIEAGQTAVVEVEYINPPYVNGTPPPSTPPPPTPTTSRGAYREGKCTNS